MASDAVVELREVSKRYGTVEVVRGVSLRVIGGEIFSLLGPSGCGKTTSLRMVAGFVVPSRGDVLIKGKVVTSVPSYRRNVAMVFQHYALFPHLTVFDNVSFGLRMRKVERSATEQRVRATLKLVNMEPYLKTYPRQLSGGQQQRVALARALVVNPDVLLLDEPLSSLDAKLRQEVRVEIRELVRRVGMTALYVTHDQEEALAISDRLAVMNAGRVEQVGTPLEIYDRPQSVFVATFIGTANVFRAKVASRGHGVVRLQTDTGLSITAVDTSGSVTQSAVAIVRPERVLVGAEAAQMQNRVEARVTARVFVGETTHYRAETDGGETVTVHQQNRARGLAEGERVTLGWSPEDVRIVMPPSA